MADGARKPGGPGGPPPDDLELARRRRNRRLARTGVVGLFGLLLIIFVIENSQTVNVRFWGVHSHPRLIWVIVGCLAIGGAVGYFIGRPGRRRGNKGRARKG
jgi:uncharacterized integral membrane protein